MRGKIEKNSELFVNETGENESSFSGNSACELARLERSKNAKETEQQEILKSDVTSENCVCALAEMDVDEGVEGELSDKNTSDKKNKKRKKKRLFEYKIPVLKNSRKNIKKISKKFDKNMLNNSQNASLVGGNVAETETNFIGKNGEKIEQKSLQNLSDKAGVVEHQNSKNNSGFAINFALDQQKENTEKITKKSTKNTLNNEQKIEENSLKISHTKQQSETKSQEKSAETGAIKNENKLQKNTEKIDKIAEEERHNPPFIYAEIMPKTSKKQKQQDELFARLLADRVRADERRKIEENERLQKEEKMRDIMRQRKSIEYGLNSIERKAEKWRKISEEAYEDAMLNRFTLLLGDKGKKFFGMATYDIYMGVSLTAMRYCLEYQHDLDLEREKIRQKDRALAELMERM